MAKLTKENSKLYDSLNLWQENDKMKEALEKYVKICENWLKQFHLNQTSKEHILGPMQLIIEHLCEQTSLLYSGWKKCEEDWFKKHNSFKRKTEQKEAIHIFENDNLRETVTKMEEDIRTFEKLIAETTNGRDYSDQNFAFNYANSETIKSLVQNWNGGNNGVRENIKEEQTTTSSDDFPLLPDPNINISPVKKESLNNSINCRDSSQYISQSLNDSECIICKCTCKSYPDQPINQEMEQLTIAHSSVCPGNNCRVIKDVSPAQFITKVGILQTNETPSLPTCDEACDEESVCHCQCNNLFH